MKRSSLWIILPALLLARNLHAQAAPSIWQGTYTAASEQHRLLLQIASPQPGPAANALYIEFLRQPTHLDAVSESTSTLNFAVNHGQGIYSGKLAPDHATASGTWTWDGQAAPLTLHRTPPNAAWPVPFQYQYHLHNVTYARPTPAEPRIPFSPRLAVDYMEQGALAWTAEWQCVACHTNGTYMVVRPSLTPQLGAPQKALRDFFVQTLQQGLAVAPAQRATDSDVEPTQIVYIAAGLALWDAQVLHRLSPETAQALNLMFDLQTPTGTWVIGDDNNPPLESSPFQLATVAARAVANAPGWLTQPNDPALTAKVRKLESYLRSDQKMQGDYDRTDLLWTASEYPGLLSPQRTSDLVAMVFAHQQFDGGWSIRTFARPEQWGKGNRAAKLRAEIDLASPSSDGHMTGLAIIALRKAGVPAADPHIQRGIAWLKANQRASGRWYTRSLNRDGWQFITYSGTAYPLLALALCDALPDSSSALAKPPTSPRSR